MSDARTPNWRDNGDEPSLGPVGARPWQPNEAATPDPTPGPSKRSIKRTIALLTLVGIAVAFGIVIVLLRPIKPACLVLIGSGYETNLLLPLNVHGWNGLSHLEKEVTQEEDFKDMVRLPWDQPTKMRRVGERVEMKDQTWKELWDKVDIASYKEKTVVVFLSLHGMADKDEAYLLPNSAKKQAGKGFNGTRIAFREVLDSLKAVTGKKIVLLLDVSHVDVHWPIGMLHNDFVKRLQEKYGDEIKSAGNLVVICSAGPDQRSWASEELQRSIFAHFVTQALKGAGQTAKESVTALNLFKFVEDKVDKWAQTNRARNQTPVMIGSEAVAKEIDIVHISESYTETEAPARTFSPEGLRGEWNRWKDLKQEQAPQVYNPDTWRLYQETLLRYEQLQRAGDPTGKAADLKKQLDKLYADLTSVRALEKAFASLGNSFPMPQVLGYRPATDDLRDSALNDLLTSLRKADTPEERTKILARYKDKSPQERQYLRSRVSQLMLNDTLAQPKMDRVQAQERLAEGEREFGALQRAAEVHFLKMIQDADAKLDDDIVNLALRVQMLAEEVAVSAGAGSGSTELYAEVIFPWIRGDLAQADALRREGEDLMFGDPKTHGPKARAKLNEAREQYEKARAQTQKLQKALALRDEVAAELPPLAAWLAALPPLRRPNKDEVKGLRDAAEQLGNSLADLRAHLELELKKAPPTDDVAQMASDLRTIREGYQNLCDELMRKGAVLQQNWHALDSVLSIPPVDAKDEDVAMRISLLTRVRVTSAELHRAGNAEGKTEEEDAPKVRVDRQRKLLRASLKAYDDIQGHDKDVIDDKARDFFLTLPTEIVAKADGLAGEETDLVAAANWCRTIPGGLVEQVKNEKSERLHPVDRLRRLRTYRLLLALAERTFEDHWFEPGMGKGTFYVSAGRAYLDSARGLFDRSHLAPALVRAEEELQRKMVPGGLTIPRDPDPHWTTEFEFPLGWHVQADKDVPPGSPMIWIDVKKGKADQLWQPEPRKAVTPWPTPNKDYTDAFRLSKATVFDAGDVKVTFNALYRGQREKRELAFLRSEPKIIVRQYPAPDKVSFAARMDKGFDYGAISIVLDNSGSMNYVHPEKSDKDIERSAGYDEKGKPNGKKELRRFDFALEALGHVLRKIPDNTSLSLYTLGGKEDGKFVTGPRLYREAKPWRRESQLDNLLADLQDAPGEIASPIAEGIIKSMKEGFPPNFKGPKVILVLTDGDDNSSFGVRFDPNDPEVVKKHAEKVRAELKKANLDFQDVQVVMVCFIQEFSFSKKDNPEFRRAKKQFEGLSFVDLNFVPEGDKLGGVIEEQVRPRVQLRVDDKPAPGFQTGQPVNYPGDKALKWNPVAPNNFRAHILKARANDIGVEMPPGQNIFAVLKRSENTLYLEQGILGLQPEIAKRSYQKETDGWLVSLIENFHHVDNKLSEIVVLEKTETDRSVLRQAHPGFTWLELDAADGARPDQTLTWGNEWSVPAAGFRLEMPAWPGRRPKVNAWFWPDDRKKLLANDALVSQSTIPVELAKEMEVSGTIAAKPRVESALWEVHEITDAAGVKTKENCLVVRVRHQPKRPVWVGLKEQRSDVGSEHHYFPDANKCTIYFYRLAKIEEINLVFIDIEGFKAAAKSVTFTPDTQWFRAQPMFLNKAE